MADVDSQQGDIHRRAEVPGAQHGAVTTQGDDEVKGFLLYGLAQAGIVHGPHLRVSPPGLQVTDDVFGFLKGIRDTGVRQDGDCFGRGTRLSHIAIIIAVFRGLSNFVRNIG